MSDYGYDSDEYDLYDDGWLYIAEEDHLAVRYFPKLLV